MMYTHILCHLHIVLKAIDTQVASAFKFTIHSDKLMKVDLVHVL